MTGVALAGRKRRETGLNQALLYVEDYETDGWGWWCPKCSTPEWTIKVDGFVSRDKARRSAIKHEERRGH